MKTLDLLENGDRIVRLTAKDWDGIATATEIAFQEEEPIPEAMRATAAHLYETLHQEGPAPTRTLAPLPEPEPTRWSPFTRVCDGCGQTFRICWDTILRAVEDEVDNVQPLEGLDPMENERRAQGITLAEVVSGIQWCLHCVAGDDAPVDEYVGGVNDKNERPVAAFVDENAVPFFAYPRAGCFLGFAVQDGSGRKLLLYCPMNADGTADKENVGEVVNPEGLDFTEVNNLLLADFLPEQFPGR